MGICSCKIALSHIFKLSAISGNFRSTITILCIFLTFSGATTDGSTLPSTWMVIGKTSINLSFEQIRVAITSFKSMLIVNSTFSHQKSMFIHFHCLEKYKKWKVARANATCKLVGMSWNFYILRSKFGTVQKIYNLLTLLLYLGKADLVSLDNTCRLYCIQVIRWFWSGNIVSPYY